MALVSKIGGTGWLVGAALALAPVAAQAKRAPVPAPAEETSEAVPATPEGPRRSRGYQRRIEKHGLEEGWKVEHRRLWGSFGAFSAVGFAGTATFLLTYAIEGGEPLGAIYTGLFVAVPLNTVALIGMAASGVAIKKHKRRPEGAQFVLGKRQRVVGAFGGSGVTLRF